MGKRLLHLKFDPTEGQFIASNQLGITVATDSTQQVPHYGIAFSTTSWQWNRMGDPRSVAWHIRNSPRRSKGKGMWPVNPVQNP
ncbi:MAG: hypothetical protein WBX11_02240 [Thiobacillaceae bacterium]